ncbi:MAG: hypothetical protein K6F53_03520 [Lachnospiraceae bacterium]|nr:hypothetical protein [Lachnospiraceae bacterium]
MKKNLKFIIIGAVLILIVLGYYYYIANIRKPKEPEPETTKPSVVRELLARDLSNDYPPTPKEVAKYYADITTAFYTEDYSDEEFVSLALKLQQLYDAELVANTPSDQYINNLRSEILLYKESGIVISSYATSSSADVFYFDQDGRSWARLNIAFTVKQERNVGLAKETFVLRKDENKHWKIYGWAVAGNEEEGGNDDGED